MGGRSFTPARDLVGSSPSPAGSVATVALDASVLINFLILNRVGILADLSTAATLPNTADRGS